MFRWTAEARKNLFISGPIIGRKQIEHRHGQVWLARSGIVKEYHLETRICVALFVLYTIGDYAYDGYPSGVVK